MLSYLRSTQYRPVIKQRDTLQPGCWIRSERPTDDEQSQLVELGIDQDLLADALDPHEVPRVELEDGWTYFLTRLPDTDDDFNDFTTPIVFALGPQYIVTVSRDSLGRLWQPFIDNVKAPTTQKTKLFMMMLEAVIRQYETRVASINRQMRATTSDVRSLGSKDIMTITEYERKLNDYLDALQPTNSALEKILGGRLLPLYEDDRDLVEDLSIEFEQLIARCKSLLRTITNVRDSYRAVMDTRLNETIRLLTVITLAFTVPMMISGIYGMNVSIPGEHEPYAFWIIIIVSIVLSGSLALYFLRKK
ncbi:MAG: magnesium transporter CorA family protein [Candidatus Nomurabacteria bacterium]|nr:MAG: magnesium transporter CorA family protein [Candidatus Nomurabacteria bacterium]